MKFFQSTALIGLIVALVLSVVYPFVLLVYWTMILTEILIMGLLAMSFNLLFGYTGLLSFGQAGSATRVARKNWLPMKIYNNDIWLCEQENEHHVKF